MKKGLTLIEILIVAALIAMLSLMISGNFMTSLKRGRDAKRKSDLKAAQSCLEQYFSVNNNYPLLNGALTSSVLIPCGGTNTVTIQDPTNPTTQYIIAVPAIRDSFTITATLESETPNTFSVSNQQ